MIDRETVIALAREAGGDDYGLFLEFLPELERFAALVAAHEREECAKVCDEWAKANYVYVNGALRCADAIRSRTWTIGERPS